MRIATISQRLCLITGSGAIDVHAASGGQFGADPAAVYPRWEEFTDWAGVRSPTKPRAGPGAVCRSTTLGSPSPAPRQVFGIGLNYSDHVAESGLASPRRPRRCSPSSRPASPARTARSPCRRAGTPTGKSSSSSSSGRTARARARRAPPGSTWPACPSARTCPSGSCRWPRTPPQFSLGKSYPGFGPIGPWLVTPDEFSNPDDLELGCTINGEQMQKARTRDLIFSVSELIEQLSAVTPLLPGDVIFTGTPSGVGLGPDAAALARARRRADQLHRGHRRDAAHLRGRRR